MSIRQRILYLNTTSRSIRSAVIGFALHEPVESIAPQIRTDAEMPYETVHDAVRDGWRVVHFPAQRDSVDPEQVGIFGYEFILEQMVKTDE